MAGGRPPKGDTERYPALEELAEWFRRAIADAGYESPNAVVRAEIAHKNVVYGACSATRLLKLPVLKSLAVALERDPDEIVPLWVRAKEALDRAGAESRQAAAPRLKEWTELPLPNPAVRNLLEAQAKAVERLPYDMLGVAEPPLSAVYVRQSMRAQWHSAEGGARNSTQLDGGSATQGDSAARDETQTIDAQLPVPEALARHEHLLITGEPGAGKSTLSSHLAWTLSRIWLREDTSLEAPVAEPVLPVRVAARTLVDQPGSWSTVLCQALRRTLGHSLVADPDARLFLGRMHGARWMVLVDGLDEIADRESRAEVVRMIAQHARTDSDYRFVITSRPLSDPELAPLRGALIGEYRMEPFGTDELSDFAAKWFAAQYQDKEQARTAADRFLGETEDGRLRDLVRNPLLATIAAVTATAVPTHPLPTSRLSLYQRFFEHLLTRGAGSEGAVRQGLMRRYRDDPGRRELHLWLNQRKRDVLGVLGRCRLEGESSLLEAALEWVRPQLREGWAVTGWEADVREFLQGTGLLVRDEDDYRFLHHSFAEYFAAQSYAQRIPPSFPDAEDWILRAFKDDERTLAMFVFCLWGERDDCDGGRLAEQLRTGAVGGHERPLLAGLLVAEGVTFGEADREQTFDRLEAVARCSVDDEYRERAAQVLGALGGQPGVLERLERMARCEFLDASIRFYAVEAYGKAGTAEVTQELLGLVLSGVYGLLGRAARIACTLGEDAREAVRGRAWQMVAEPDANSWEMSFATEALAGLGRAQEAEELARRILQETTSWPTHTERAVEAWLTSASDRAMAEAERLTLALPETDQARRWVVGKVLDKLGAEEAAARIAHQILGANAFHLSALEWAAEMWVKARGAGAREAITAAFERSSADIGHFYWHPASLLRTIAPFDPDESTADWARGVFGVERWAVYGTGEAVRTWLAAAGVTEAEQIMQRLDRGHVLSSYDRSRAAKAFFEAGALDQAREMAELALSTPNARRDSFEEAARVLLKTGGDDGVVQLKEIWFAHPMLSADVNWLNGVLDALPRFEDRATDAVVGRFARELVGLPAAATADVLRGLQVLLSNEGHAVVPWVLETAMAHRDLFWVQRCTLARELAALGERDAALTLWRHVLGFPNSPRSGELQLLSDLQAAGETETAVTWLSELIADPATAAPRRLRLRQLLAWLVTADPGLLALVPHDAGPVAGLQAVQRTASALPKEPREASA
ncbi:NACHT domain-containing protein [Streptomyces sp. NPDC001530]|uniref:NACHT domain-containing protein n=1 Tax=Streptomyces sp. NPDC001530 TaxID=3364582 RepID=UPI003674D347